ncbi:hypothetical protein [Rhodopirellula bahusiensis]|uniref:Uncharacterized protein n=1 Tax=Rhodopirellula bahusiensis TaxID=2014065 RepID=A0A2G1WCE7_9BACT|nr:hypothetical protein [Rhodopirellula bahusiensis]PHQ36714.1 hypothetical protein CEE69_05065 [Rhodopirellula bahusiensis]
MRHFCLTAVFSVCFLSTASAQYPSYVEHTPPGPPPIRKTDKGILEAEWLEAIAMTDYEVWIAEDTSQKVQYEVFLKSEDGWHNVGEAVGGMNVQRRFFDSREEAEFFALLQMALNPSNLDFRIKSHVPDMTWQYVDTFDSNAEAEEFLNGLLDLIGDNFVGDIRKVTVLPRSLQ